MRAETYDGESPPARGLEHERTMADALARMEELAARWTEALALGDRERTAALHEEHEEAVRVFRRAERKARRRR